MVCRAAFSRQRFLQIKCVLRFDDPARRNREDSLAPVREMFTQFSDKLRNFYEPSADLTVDEQLLEYHGRVQFRQYIASKPGKFGIKIFWLCCAESFYVLTGVVYIGCGTVRPGEGVTAKALTLHLMQPFIGTGRNLTGDNWFTSLELVNELRNGNTSYIGTVRHNSRGLPPIAKQTANRVKKDTKVYYNDDATVLISFWDKGNRPVLLFDTFHRNVDIPAVGEKPSTVLQYNKTKSGVDIADKRVRGLSCKRKCRRWPYAIFSNVVDIACNNASIIFAAQHPEIRRQEAHYLFNKNAGYQLLKEQLNRRANKRNLKENSKIALRQMGIAIGNPRLAPAAVNLQRQTRCALCPRNVDRKTKLACSICRKPICQEHRSTRCCDCELL